MRPRDERRLEGQCRQDDRERENEEPELGRGYRSGDDDDRDEVCAGREGLIAKPSQLGPSKRREAVAARLGTWKRVLFQVQPPSRPAASNEVTRALGSDTTPCDATR